MSGKRADRIQHMLSRKRRTRKRAMKDLVKTLLKPKGQEQLKAAS